MEEVVYKVRRRNTVWHVAEDCFRLAGVKPKATTVYLSQLKGMSACKTCSQ